MDDRLQGRIYKAIMMVHNYIDEEWKPVPFFQSHYECSNYGRIRNTCDTRTDCNGLLYKKKSGIVNGWKDVDGYLNFDFHVNEFKKRWKIHRLVAFLFVGGWANSLEINHKDYNRQNNYHKNLEYKTKIENVKYSALAGRFNKNAEHFKVKKWREGKTTLKLDLNGNVLEEFRTLAEAAKSVKGRKSIISRVITKRGKSAYGYGWQYK